MSQKNVELVRQSFEGFNVGGIETVLSLSPPDVVWYPIPDWVEDPVYRGHEGVRQVIAWTDEFDRLTWTITEIRDVQDRVLVQADLTGRMKKSDAPIRQAFSAIYSGFRDGTIGKVRWFRTWRDALEAAGA